MCLVKKISIKESHVCHGIDLLTMRMWTLSQWENELNKDYVYAFDAVQARNLAMEFNAELQHHSGLINAILRVD